MAIVSWNTRELLLRCLAALRADADGGVADVWVLDNASSDGSAQLVRERFPWVNLIASTENLGFGTGVNVIARKSRTEWLAPANADTQVTPGALRALLQAGNRHQEAAVIAPRLQLPDGTTQHSAYPFPTIPFTLAYVSGIIRMSPSVASRWSIDSGLQHDQERDVPWVVGAFLLVRRCAWDAVGGFDEEQWMYAEDLDLGWRLSRRGWKARYVPGAVVLHNESASTTQAWGSERYARWHASTYRWLIRRRGLMYARVIAALNVAGFLARAVLLSLPAAAGNTRWRAARRNALNAARAHAIGLRSRRRLERVR